MATIGVKQIQIPIPKKQTKETPKEASVPRPVTPRNSATPKTQPCKLFQTPTGATGITEATETTGTTETPKPMKNVTIKDFDKMTNHDPLVCIFTLNASDY